MKKSNTITNRVAYGDVVEARKPLPDWVRTPELYMPQRKQSAEMTIEQARRGLCAKSAGNLNVCRQCPRPCPMGKRCMELVSQDERMPSTIKVPGKEEEPAKSKPPAKPAKPAAKTNPTTITKATGAKPVLPEFSARLRDAFESSGLSQSELGRRVGSKQCSIAEWITRGVVPSVPTLVKLCQELKVSADWLLGLEVVE